MAASRVIARSIAWELPSEHRRAVTATHERAVLQAGGVVIRYGQLYGPGTFYPAAPPEPPRIHVDDAARALLLFARCVGLACEGLTSHLESTLSFT